MGGLELCRKQAISKSNKHPSLQMPTKILTIQKSHIYSMKWSPSPGLTGCLCLHRGWWLWLVTPPQLVDSCHSVAVFHKWDQAGHNDSSWVTSQGDTRHRVSAASSCLTPGSPSSQRWMDLRQIGLATWVEVDDVLCDGTVPIIGSHPGQHLALLSVAGDGNIDWSIRYLCIQGREKVRQYSRERLDCVRTRYGNDI